MTVTYSMGCTTTKEPKAEDPVHFVARGKQYSPYAAGSEWLQSSHTACYGLINCKMTSNRNSSGSEETWTWRSGIPSKNRQGHVGHDRQPVLTDSDDLRKGIICGYHFERKDNTPNMCQNVVNWDI